MGALKCILCCGMTFDDTTSLLNHVEHYLQSVYECPICCVQVQGIEEIRSHLSVHCDEKADICDKKLEVNNKIVLNLGQSSDQQISDVTVVENSLLEYVDISDCSIIPTENKEKKCDSPCESKIGRTTKLFEDNLNIISKESFDVGSVGSDGVDLQGVQDVAKETESCLLNMKASVAKKVELSKGKGNNIFTEDKRLSNSGREVMHRRCPVCNCIIIHSLYKKHLWEHQNKKEKFPCEKCGKKYQHFKSYEQHIAAMHNGRQGFTCEICGKVFESRQGINMHKLKHEEKRNYACDKCDKKFYQSTTLKDHMSTHSEKKLKCPMCGNNFKSNKSLANHIRNLHNSSDRCFCCHTCGLTFKSNYNFRDHMSVHNLDSSFQCKFCDKSFTKYTSKYQHERRLHSDRGVEDLYVCEQCDQQFKSKSSHAHHMKMHQGMRDHQCLDCLQKFATKDILKKHVLIHQGVKPFKCEQCGKNFRQKTTYISHLRLHTGEKPFGCCNCGKKFRHRATLRKHQCFEVQLNNCNICGKSFSNERSFKTHRCCKADENQESIHSKIGSERSFCTQSLPLDTDNILIIDETGNSEAVAIQDFLMLNLENNVPVTTAIQDRILTLQLQDGSASESIISNMPEDQRNVAATVAGDLVSDSDIQMERTSTSFTDEH